MTKLVCLSLFVLFNATAAFGQAPESQQSAWFPAATSKPEVLPVVQSSDITDSRVVEMTKLGLGDDIIIARIKNGNCNFQLLDSDLMDLRKAGVSSRVVAVMLDSSALTQPHVTVDKKEVTLHTLGQAKVGGRLGHHLTAGIKSVKEKAYLDGPHSSVFASSAPVIGIELPLRAKRLITILWFSSMARAIVAN